MLTSRRQFFADVSKGMLLASIGPALSRDLGMSTALADEAVPALKFGNLEPLVCLMQETEPKQLIPVLVDKLRNGLDLKHMVSAAALANARTFGGEDYVGFHTMMAMYPAYQMAQELTPERQPLPLLKVLYRNSNRLQEKEGRKNEVLHTVPTPVKGTVTCDSLRDACHQMDIKRAEGVFAAFTTPDDALNALLPTMEEGTEVHRVVMVSRAWDLLDLVGKEHAQTLLRQSVHYCVQNEKYATKNFADLREMLPKVFDRFHLEGKSLSNRQADDQYVSQLSETFFNSTPQAAAEAAAAAIVEGYSCAVIGEAIALSANQLVLRDNGRPKNQTAPNKPEGSIHGDSIGVHASDSANAWKNLARVSNSKNAMACLILGAYQVAKDRRDRGGDFLKWEPYPRSEQRELVRKVTPETVMRELEGAICENNQARAAALVHRASELSLPERPVFDLFLRYAISEDGALHAEKYYRTVSEEFAAHRPAFRWRQLIALARVTASENGQPAPGYTEACKLLRLT